MRRPRRLALSAAALGLALAATGCTYMSPVQTHDFYQAGDGTNANLEVDGQFHTGVRNAVLVLDEAQGGEPVFSATVVNYSTETATVELQAESEGSVLFTTSVSVPAESTVEIGPETGQQQVEVSATDVEPGTILDLTVSSGDQSTTISLPVLDTSLSHYGADESAAG